MSGLMRSLARGTFARAGFRIERLPRLEDLLRAGPSPTRGLVLEFVGPAGVGKSTIFRQWAAGRAGAWFHAHQADWIPPRHVQSPEVERIASRLFFEQAADNRSHGDGAWDAVGRTRYHARIILQDLLMRAGGLPRGFAVEEGLFHVFRRRMGGCSDQELACLGAGRVLVNLRPDDPETVIGRKMARRPAPGQPPPETGSGALRRILDDREDLDRLATRLAQLGRPVLVLRAEADPRDNARELLAFERGILGLNGAGPRPEGPASGPALPRSA
jgi:hypothetical protein